MKAEIGYTISRLLYGFFLMWYGINILLSPIHKSELEKVDKTFVDFKNITDILIPGLLNNMTNIFDLNQLKNNSNSISLLIPYLLIIEGFFCLCGYAASIHFIMCGILLDLIFIHNFFYYRDEKLKVNVLKLLSILGGAFFIV